jgi:hypothetical protein
MLPPFVRTSVACVLLVVIYYLAPVEPDVPTGQAAIRVILSLLGTLAVAWLVARQIRRQLGGDEQAPLAGLVLALVVAVMFFALVDYTVAVEAPGEFVDLNTKTDAVYFALSTLATVGFGDVHAAGQGARLLVTIQMLFNLVVIAAGGSVLANQISERVRERVRRPGDKDVR